MKDSVAFRDGKFVEEDFTGKTLEQLINGPYVLKFNSGAWGTIYFAGADEDMNMILLNRKKVHRTMASFVDVCVNFFYFYNIDWMNCYWGKTFGELRKIMQELTEDKLKIELPQPSKVEVEVKPMTLDSVIE